MGKCKCCCGSGGGRSTQSVVEIPITGIELSGGLYYPTFGTPENLVRNSVSNITITPGAPAGQQILSSRAIFKIEVCVCLQYISQPSARRTFLTIQSNGTNLTFCAAGVPAGNNNWRSDRDSTWYGIEANSPTRFTIGTNAVGPLTFNSGMVFITFQ